MCVYVHQMSQTTFAKNELLSPFIPNLVKSIEMFSHSALLITLASEIILQIYLACNEILQAYNKYTVKLCCIENKKEQHEHAATDVLKLSDISADRITRALHA